MKHPIRVGIIGVNANGGWASLAHVPALQALPEFELTALSNRTRAAAEAAGQAFAVPYIFENNQDLIDSPHVDLVVVTVRVPEHQALITAALEAGKNVFSEWPLGNGLAEAEALAQLARAKGVAGAVGLQSRAVPAINYVRDLIREGYIGEVLSTSLVGSGIIFGAFTPQAFAYAADARNGAGMIYSTFGNAVDALCYCLGEFTELTATATNRRKTTTLVETGEPIPMTAYDQIAVTGRLESGAVATVHYRGGMSRGTNFHWEINGTEGDIIVTAGGGSPAVFPLTIQASHGDQEALAVLPVPASYQHEALQGLSVPAQNVAENYARLAQDLREGTHRSATFADAVLRHRMIAAIEVAAATGTRQSYSLEGRDLTTVFAEQG